MSLSYGPNLGLLENANTGEAHDVALRALLRGLDGLVQANVKGYLTNTPPGSPANGDLYIVGAAPTGAWAGQGSKVARWSSIANGWEFYAPKNGWILQSNSALESYVYTGSAWTYYYQEGTWTPSATSLGGSGITLSGKYWRIGNRVDFAIRADGTALTSTAGTTYLSLPFTPARNSVGGSDNNNVIGGVSVVSTSSRFYLATIGSTNAINSSGTIFLN